MAASGSSQIKPDSLAKSIELKLPGFKISGQDLKTPTKKLVISYYTAVMEEFGVNFGSSYRFDDTAHALKLYHIVAHVFSKLGIQFFSFDDIINPASKRTLQLFAIMDNFHSFADQQAREVSNMQEKRIARLETFRKLNSIKNELLEQQNQQTVHRATRLEQGKQLQNRIEELKAGKLELAEKQRTLCEATKIIEGKLVSANNSVDKIAASIGNVDEEITQLDKKIVTKSLEELQQEVLDLETVLCSLENEMKVQNIGLQQKMERVRSLEAEYEDLKDSNHDLDQACTQWCKEKEISGTMQDILQETESVAASLKLTQKQLRTDEEESARLQKLHDETKLELDQKLQTLKNKLQDLKQELTTFLKSQEDESVELLSVREKIEAVRQKKEEEIEVIKNEHRELEEAHERYKQMVKHYTEEIIKGLRRVSEATE